VRHHTGQTVASHTLRARCDRRRTARAHGGLAGLPYRLRRKSTFTASVAAPGKSTESAISCAQCVTHTHTHPHARTHAHTHTHTPVPSSRTHTHTHTHLRHLHTLILLHAVNDAPEASLFVFLKWSRPYCMHAIVTAARHLAARSPSLLFVASGGFGIAGGEALSTAPCTAGASSPA
jgi:hypothetical protein